MFVQSLSNIWSIHYHTAQVCLLSSNMSYAVFTAQCLTATNKGRKTLFNGTNLFFLVMKWGRSLLPVATALRVRKGPLCTLNRPSPLHAAFLENGPFALCVHSVWALREMDDVRFLSLPLEVHSAFPLEAIAKCRSADLNEWHKK